MSHSAKYHNIDNTRIYKKELFKNKLTVIKYMLNMIKNSNMTMTNMMNFYVETNSQGYVLHFVKPEKSNNAINGLHFYFKHIRK